MVLGQDARGLLGAGQDGGITMSGDLKAIDAMPETIETLDTSSKLYSQAIQKFKIIIKSYLPIIDNMTSKSVQNEGL